MRGSSWLEWVVGSGCSGEWALLGDQGRLEWELTSFDPRKVPWVGDDGVCETLGVVMSFVVCILCCIGMIFLGVVGRGQLGMGEACMEAKGTRGRYKIRFSPCMATSPQVNPAGSSDAL